jgi:hypothetical protein
MTPIDKALAPKTAQLWMGLTVGWLAQLGLKSFVPLVVLVATRFFSLETENSRMWLEDASDSSHPLWYALQCSVFLSSICAGALGASLSKGRYWALAAGLAILSLLTTFFEPFPPRINIDEGHLGMGAVFRCRCRGRIHSFPPETP